MNYQEYLQSEDWKITREAALKRAHYKCQLCASKQDLEVHHNNYSNLGNEKPSDLVVLCDICHETYHKVLDIKYTGTLINTEPVQANIPDILPDNRNKGEKAGHTVIGCGVTGSIIGMLYIIGGTGAAVTFGGGAVLICTPIIVTGIVINRISKLFRKKGV
jgi:hypothetical protein